MNEKFFESPRVTEIMSDGRESFELDIFLHENKIDRNDPEVAQRIANFEKSLQNQKEITHAHLLDLLAFHGISANYVRINKRKHIAQNVENLQTWSDADNLQVQDIAHLPVMHDLQKDPTKVESNTSALVEWKQALNNREIISEAEKIEANRLGQQIQQEFTELRNAQMSPQEIEIFFQEKWIQVHLNVGEHIQDVPVISALIGRGLKRRKKEKFIETMNTTLPLSDILAVKEIHGNIVAFTKRRMPTDFGLVLIKEDPRNSFENFVKDVPIRSMEVASFRSWIAGKGRYWHSEKKDVPMDGFKSVNPDGEKDFQVFDLKTLKDDESFVFRSWNGLISIDMFWLYDQTYFINPNMGYTDAEIQQHNAEKKEMYDFYRKKQREDEMKLELSPPTSQQLLQWQNYRKKEQDKQKQVSSNSNNYYQNGYHVQKTSGVNVQIDDHGGISITGNGSASVTSR